MGAPRARARARGRARRLRRRGRILRVRETPELLGRHSPFSTPDFTNAFSFVSSSWRKRSNSAALMGRTSDPSSTSLFFTAGSASALFNALLKV